MDFPHSNRYSTARQQPIRRSPGPSIPAQSNVRTARQQPIRRFPGPSIPAQGNVRTSPGREQPDSVSAGGIIAVLVIAVAMIVFWLW